MLQVPSEPEVAHGCEAGFGALGSLHRMTSGLGGFALAILIASLAYGEVLLDDKLADGSRAETSRPAEAAIWVGRKNDVATAPGKLSTSMTPASQKLWTYFTDKEPVSLAVGQKLIVSLSFIPRGKLAETTSRSFRLGVFHDPTSPRVEADVNSDAGGPDMPWRDATGYAVQMLLSGDEYSSTKPLDLGRRVNLESPSLLGSSGDYAKVSGGQPVTFVPDREYTLSLHIARLSQAEVEVTASIRQGSEMLSTWSVTDDGNYLGTDPVYEKFDQLFIRISDNATTADRIDFTNFAVELAEIDTGP